MGWSDSGDLLFWPRHIKLSWSSHSLWSAHSFCSGIYWEGL